MKGAIYMSVARFPVCRDGKADCFAFRDGKCSCLKDTRFNKVCPFYKSVKQVTEEDPNFFRREYRV